MAKKEPDKPSWRNKMKVGADLITFNDKRVQLVKFLDDGELTEADIKDEKTGKVKTVDQASYIVVDLSDNKEKTFNVVSNRLAEKLNELAPDLTNLTVEITKIGEGFKTDWNVRIIKQD